MRVLCASAAEWEEGRGYRKRVLVPEAMLGIEGSLIQEVSFRPGESVPMHCHKSTKEIFIALDRAEFVVNGERAVLGPGDVMICEPGDVHGNPEIERPFRILVMKVDYDPDDTVWIGE